MPHADGLLFNPDDIRTMVIRGRLPGLRRERVLASLMCRVDDFPLTGVQVSRIFDEEWPGEHGSASGMSEMSICFFRLTSSTRTEAVLRGLAATAGVRVTRMPHCVNVVRVEYPFGRPPDKVVRRLDPYAMFEPTISPEVRRVD